MINSSNKINTIDDYISLFPADVQLKLETIRKLIHEIVPEATEKISYQMPTFYLNGNLVHFAAFNNHIGFYPTPSGIEAFSKDLAKYKSGKGSVQFPLDEPLPLDLITSIVIYRVDEMGNKKSTKK